MPEVDRYQQYEVLKRPDGSLWELGRGAMGITYKAYDINLLRTVALKVVNAAYFQSDTARQRFLREARAGAALRHKNIGSIYYLGSDHGDYFYATEFIDGQTAEEYVKQRGPLEPAETINIALQVADVLAAAARRQLVHGNLKPASLMLVDEDGAKVVKVIDFGFAKSEKCEGEDSTPTVIGFAGTPHYASPEHIEELEIDVRSDIYSLGATLYYLVTGRPPFSGSVAQVMMQHLYKPVPSEPLEGCPVSFVNLLLGMMEKDRDKRPQTPLELRERILRCREGVVSVPEEAKVPPENTKLPIRPKATEPEKDHYQQYVLLKRADGSLWELGRGAMGVTYKAYDVTLSCAVALKVINTAYFQSETERQRFLGEARAAAAMRHQNVANIFGPGNDHGDYFYVVEFVDGQTVEQYVHKEGKLSPTESLDIALQVTRALVAAAKHHLLHGNLKPSNLILIEEDGDQIVKVTDFGLTKSVKREGEMTLTAGGFAGTPHYASPEQLEEREIDVRSDIYSLGATLYFLVTGQPPFSGPVGQVISQHLYRRVPREALEGCPVSLVNLILSMMQKDRDERPQNPLELRERILRCREEVVSAPEEAEAPLENTKFPDRPKGTQLEKHRYEHYEILKRADGSLWELGRGTMGITYKACDTNLRYTVALKVINTAYLQNETWRQQLLRDARAIAALRHQNVASMFHLGSDRGDYFYVTEFIDGQTVEEYVKCHGKLDPLRALKITFQVTRALAAAARQRLVHRDLKPANLMLVDDDGDLVVKVIDFSLAKSVKREGEMTLMAGGFVGTPHYASPEQLEERLIDTRSDIYSLGVTLYYMVAGQPPFSGTIAQVMGQHLYQVVPIEPLQGCPGSFVRLVLSMVQKDRDKRPQNPAELRQQIQNCFHDMGGPGLQDLEKISAVNREHEEKERPSVEESKTPPLSAADKSPHKLRAFLCHSSQDKMAVRQLYRQLSRDGFDAWLDEEDLIPGQMWDTQIRAAVRASDVVIICLSRSSITQEGYIQKEIRYALDIADEKPAGTIFLIPARLDKCDVPERLKHVQWVDLFKDQGYQQLLKALLTR